MFYYKKNDNIIEKYQVNFDKDKLRKLCDSIKNDCSTIKHYEYDGEYVLGYNSGTIRNLVATDTGKVKEYDTEVRSIYHFSYDEYEPPHLVYLIYGLLSEDPQDLYQILNYTIENTKSSIEQKINSLSREFNRISIEEISKKKERLKELERLLKLKELNKNQKDIESYYKELISLIEFKLVDSISISEINRIEKFLKIKLLDINIKSNKKSFVKLLKM